MSVSFGRGIESLIPKKRPEESLPSKKEAVFYIEIEKIQPNHYQPRKEFDQESLNSLAESIREHGVLQPLIVTRLEEGKKYQLIAGERRLLAAKIAGLKQVPVIIKDSLETEREKLEISLIENIQRLDLNPIERAEAFKRLEEEFHFSHAEIAKLAGVSRPAVTNTIRLLKLPREIKEALKVGKISEGQAKAILMAKEPEKQKMLFNKVIKEGLSVREIERLAQKLDVWQPKPKTLKFLEEFKELEEKAKKIFGTENLKFGMQLGKPKLTIFFKNKEEAENLLKRLIS